MKKFLKLSCILLSVILFISIADIMPVFAASSDSSEVVNIPDANLKNELLKKVGKSKTDNLTKTDLESITEIVFAGKDIASLEGLNYCTNLKSLQMINNEVSDLSPLSNLTNLKEIRLDTNNISDISPLANLTNLTSITIGGNKISDISPLANLTNLEDLYLQQNNITDISPLSNLTNLKCLDLDINNISDISILSNLKKLALLYINKNNLSDISPLANLHELGHLELNQNKIINISPLANLTSLYYLSLREQNTTITVHRNFFGTTIENPLKTLDGSSVTDITKISGEGSYNKESNTITWKGIHILKSQYYTFRTAQIKIGNKSLDNFTGTVTVKFIDN